MSRMGAAALAAVLTMLASFVVAPLISASRAQEAKDLGVIGPPSCSRINWTGPFRETAVREFDDYLLTVDASPSYWDSHEGGLNVKITWGSVANDFNLIIFEDGDETKNVGASQQVGTTSEEAFVPNASGRYLVRVIYLAVAKSDYDGVATFMANENCGGAPEVVFANTNPVQFGPATILSAHFLGAEPQVTIERRVPGSLPGAIDPNRILVDWPLTTFNQIGQLSRSTDGGDSFRLLFDPACASRSRPMCSSGGGGDTENEVNLINGNLYFSDQEGLLNEALASSTDHGDSFPVERQQPVTSLPLVDRQWLAASDTETIRDGNRKIEAFLTTRVAGTGLFLQGIDEAGRLIPQTEPQLAGSLVGGPVRVDSTRGRGHGWVYQAYDDGDVKVASASGSAYKDPDAWKSTGISEDDPILFPWLNLDNEGNAYMVWVGDSGKGTAVYYSFSSIDDPANDPGAGGRPGAKWSPQVRITPPAVTSAVFPAVTAGDPGRIAIAYMGSENFQGLPGLGFNATWHAYTAVITNALARPEEGPVVVTTGMVSHRVAHTGDICTDGAACTAEFDRSLLDLIDIGYDESGRVGVAFMDNHSSFAKPPGQAIAESPFAHFAKQVSGPSLLASNPQVSVSIPTGGRDDLRGDATWLNTARGRYLPSLDALGASVVLDGDDLVAQIPLVTTSEEIAEQDLASYNLSDSTDPPALRTQYVVRFATPDEIYHLSMERLANGTRRFFGGRLDSNDALDNGVFILGAGYHTDDALSVSGSIENDTITLRAPAAALGLELGSSLFSVTAFTMAGPTEQEEENILRTMRTVDATPPFDATLVPASVTPSPTPSASPSASLSPTPTGSPSPQSIPASVVLTPAEATSGPGSTHEVIALVTDASGVPVPGADVEWSSSGVGEISTRESTTDGSGRARAVLSSEEPGDQLVTASTTSCTEDGGCSAEAVKHWGPEFCDVFGTADNDFIRGTAAGEVICGFGGSDVIRGGGGNDVLLGGRGSDVIRGGGRNDVLRGGRGNDRLLGVGGTDILKGGGGGDELRGGRGPDRLRGGRGHDDLFGGRRRDLLRGGRGADALRGGPGADRLRGGPGRDACHTGPRDRSRGC